MDSDITVEQALVQGIGALQMIAMSMPGTDVAGVSLAAAMLIGQVLDFVIESAESAEEAVN